MKSLLLALAVIVLTTISGQAQNLSVKGAVVDTASLAKLKNASISILNAKDSTLVKFTRAVTDGTFTIGNLRAGKFILLTTYPGYADYVEHFRLDSTKTVHDFGKLNMFLKTNLLKDIVIKAKTAAIKIKGDTTEYDAGSFKVEPNAKVEDLLKQLPGIQVDKDGKITAQGQTVSKVLVDGEEFFGDDPTLVTKNLRADMIDKVQLYDKKSDQAAFTGIDDGIKNKTIDLKLKEDKKNGMFGKVDGGGLNDGFYSGQGMFNAFKGKKKFSAYGTVGNTGKTGLNWRDSEKLGTGGVSVSDDGGLYIDRSGSDELDAANFRGSGIPEIRTGGAHYDAKWDNNKKSINTNYKNGYLTVDGNEVSGSFNNIPGEGRYINTNSTQEFINSTYRQKLDATYQISPDSTTNIKFVLDGSLRSTSSWSDNTSRGQRIDSSLINDSHRLLDNDGESQSFNANAFYSKKLKKKGRTFSINLAQSLNKGSSTGALWSSNLYFDSLGVKTGENIIDQFKRNKNFSSKTSTNITYTEPITKQWSLVLNYGLSYNSSNSERKSFNKGADKNYTLLDSVYSNEFDVYQLSNQGGAVFSYKRKKTNISLGSRATAVNYNQKDIFNNLPYNRDFINWTPQASYQYKFSNYKSFRAEYNGRTTQPGVNQLQVMRINTDPQNISLGNPNLTPSFTNSFNMNFNSYKVLSSRSIYAYGSYSFTTNPIINSTITNTSTNVSTYQSVNLKNKNSNSYYIYGGYNRKITKYEFNIGLNINTDANVYYSYINEDLIKSTSNNYSAGLSLSQYKQKKYDIYMSFNPGYNTNQTSLANSKNNNGWVYNSNAGFNVYLPGKFQISSNANHEFREKTASFDDEFERLIWNASVSKKFMKQDNLILTFSGNDLLNQNNGFSRRLNDNIITQRSYVTIKRYFLLSLVWEFNKMGGGVKTPATK